jgi:hypothetical protein
MRHVLPRDLPNAIKRLTDPELDHWSLWPRPGSSDAAENLLLWTKAAEAAG